MDDDLSSGESLMQHLEGVSQRGQLVEDTAQGPEVRPGGGQWTPALPEPALVVVGLVLADLRAEVVGRPCHRQSVVEGRRDRPMQVLA